MSGSASSKAYYEEITKLEPMEVTFTIEDADLSKLNDMLKDINVRECPWFEVQDKYGNKAKYYREPQWIPCSERLPDGVTQVIIQTNGEAIHEAIYMGKDDYGHYVWRRPDNEIYWDEEVVAWKPLPEPYQEVDE